MIKKTDEKSTFTKIWDFIWHSNSILSWIVNIVLAFIIIKFLLYPGLGYLLGTTHPIVAVVSGSMEHKGSFEKWWNSNARCGDMPCTQGEYYGLLQINKYDFNTYPFRNGFNTGDIMILKNKGKIKKGDIIVFQSPIQQDPIIHRVIRIKQEGNISYYTTKGDHNEATYKFEADIPEDRVIGKAFIRIPYLGWIKIGFVKLINLLR